jgi:hypothetical protein
MINDFMYIGHIMRQDSQRKPQKAVKALAMSSCWHKPWELKHEKVHQIFLMVLVDYLGKCLEENFHPDTEIARGFFLSIHEALFVDHIIELFDVALYIIN